MQQKENAQKESCKTHGHIVFACAFLLSVVVFQQLTREKKNKCDLQQIPEINFRKSRS